MNAAQILMLVLTVVPFAGMAYAVYYCFKDGGFGPEPTWEEHLKALERMHEDNAGKWRPC